MMNLSCEKYCAISYSFPAIIVQYFLQIVNDFSHISQKGVFEISFADNFRILRLERGFSQAELAKLVGVDQAAIARYELGIYKPKFDVATKLAKIFDTTVEELYSGQTEENEPATAEQLVDGQTAERTDENGTERQK